MLQRFHSILNLDLYLISIAWQSSNIQNRSTTFVFKGSKDAYNITFNVTLKEIIKACAEFC